MSRTTTLAVLTALPLAALSIYALAQNAATTAVSQPSLYSHMLQKMDTNGDGKISLDEFLVAAGTRFQQIDTKKTGNIDATQLAKSPIAAERAQHRAERLLKHLDTAGNGYVTADEFLAAAKKRFARPDHNGDGTLTPDELTAPRWPGAQQITGEAARRRADRAGQRFARLDANHDGAITQDEYLAAATALYRQFDTQRTGRVTAGEIAAAPKAQERAERAAKRIVKHLDRNGDGVVSQDEYLAAARRRFNRLDRNADGFISADEMPAQRWAHGAQPLPAHG